MDRVGMNRLGGQIVPGLLKDVSQGFTGRIIQCNGMNFADQDSAATSTICFEPVQGRQVVFVNNVPFDIAGGNLNRCNDIDVDKKYHVNMFTRNKCNKYTKLSKTPEDCVYGTYEEAKSNIGIDFKRGATVKFASAQRRSSRHAQGPIYGKVTLSDLLDPNSQISVPNGEGEIVPLNADQKFALASSIINPQLLHQELNEIEQGFNKLLQQGVTEDGLRELSDRLQVLKAQGQEIEQAINALSRLPNAPQDQINALRGQLGNIAQRYQVLISLGRYLNNPQLLHQELNEVEQGFNALLHQELDAIGQGFGALRQQGVTGDDLRASFNRGELSDRLQVLKAQGQEIEQAINALSRLPNAPQDQINVLRGQLGNIAQRHQALSLRLQCFIGPQELHNALDLAESALTSLQGRFSEILGRPSFQNNELDGLWDEFNNACVFMNYAINAENLIRYELALQPGADQGQNSHQINQLQAAAQKRVSVQNQLINIALTAVEWQIAPLFKQEGVLSFISNWWSGFNSVQKEIDHLRKKLNSGQEVTQEELQGLFNDLSQFLQKNLQDPKQKSKFAALITTIAGTVGTAGFGALAAGASSGGSVSGAATGTIVGMSTAVPVVCCMACLASLCVAIGGAVHMYSRS